MTKKEFKKSIVEFEKAKQKLNKSKRKFVFDVKEFMRVHKLTVKVLFFGDTFGLDIVINWDNIGNSPRKIPLNVLTDFCNTFGCKFEYTNCDGNRYIFSFDGLSMGY